MKWTKDKPNIPCVFVARINYDYVLYRVSKVTGDEGEYLVWCDQYGKEIGLLDDLEADEYLVINID